MLVVNLFGAPGAGKSTGAAYVFSQLKMLGINAELVTEFAKDKIWEDNEAALKNQAYLFGKQYYRISRLQDKVDVVITDSPILLSSFYAKDPILGNEFDELVTKVFKSYHSYNVFIERTKAYNPAGRFQNEDESNMVHDEMIDFLKDHDIQVVHYKGNTTGYNELINDIVSMLN